MSNRDRVGLKGVEEAGTPVRRNLQKSSEWSLWPRQGRQQERQWDVLGFGIYFGRWDQQDLLTDLDEK